MTKVVFNKYSIIMNTSKLLFMDIIVCINAGAKCVFLLLGNCRYPQLSEDQKVAGSIPSHLHPGARCCAPNSCSAGSAMSTWSRMSECEFF